MLLFLPTIKHNNTFSWPMEQFSFWSLLYWTCEQKLITSSFLINFLYLISKILYSWFSSHLTGHYFVFCVRFFFSPQVPKRISQSSVLWTPLYLLSLSWWIICWRLPNIYIFLIQTYFLNIRLMLFGRPLKILFE